MPGPLVKLPSLKLGDELKADDLNLIISAIVQRFSGDKGLDVKLVNGQIILSLAGQEPRTLIGRQMQIQSDQGDYLICRSLDAAGNVGTGDIFVLKPWILRRTPFDGLTVNGTAYVYSSNGERLADGTETQKITQDYFAGAEITAIPLGLVIEIATDVFAQLIDMNDSARAWCEPE